MATLLVFAFVIAEILTDRRAQALLIVTAVAFFVSFIVIQKLKAILLEPGAYFIEHTTYNRRGMLFYNEYMFQALFENSASLMRLALAVM